jgi:hypothetical protein
VVFRISLKIKVPTMAKLFCLGNYRQGLEKFIGFDILFNHELIVEENFYDFSFHYFSLTFSFFRDFYF